MNIQEYVDLRKAELDHFLKYNQEKMTTQGEDWMPSEMEEQEWYEQEEAWLDMKRSGDLD